MPDEGYDYIAKGTFLSRKEDFLRNEHFIILLPVLNSFLCHFIHLEIKLLRLAYQIRVLDE